jgi:uncharacterized repeat protein (TIGR03847 family)
VPDGWKYLQKKQNRLDIFIKSCQTTYWKNHMPRFEINVDPANHVTADAIGVPGERIFYLQAWQETRTITVLVEKIQLQSLAVGIEQFIAKVSTQQPDLPEASADYEEAHMRINPPLDPIFRAGEIGLGYDNERDLMVIITREILAEGDDPEEAAAIRFWCTRSQARALARWSMEVVNRGRPICPQCNQPMEPEGHFCPKKNGHKH